MVEKLAAGGDCEVVFDGGATGRALRLDVVQVEILVSEGGKAPTRPWMTSLVSQADGHVVAAGTSGSFPDAEVVAGMLHEAGPQVLAQHCGTAQPTLTVGSGADMIRLGHELAARGHVVLFERPAMPPR